MASTLLEIAGAPRQPPTSLENAGLLLIDIQNEYLATGKVPLFEIEKAIDHAANILGLARKNKIPVVHVVHHGPPGAGFFDPQGEGGKIVPKVAPLEGEPVVIKQHADSFVGTNLKQVLDDNKIKNLFVIGFMTHNCISSTVRAAAEQHGFNVIVIANATGTRALKKTTEGKEVVEAESVHKAHLAALADFYSYVAESVDDLKIF